MIPYSYKMVDMGAIELADITGQTYDGLYAKVHEALNDCGDVVLYNWFFAGIEIVPSHYHITVGSTKLTIGEYIEINDDDTITIAGITPPVIEPVIEAINMTENGVYIAPTGVDGYSPVVVDVPSYTPIIDPITITENGTYNIPTGVDGYGPVTVNVSGGSLGLSYPSSTYVGYVNPFGQGANDWLGFNSGSAGWLLLIFDDAVKISSVIFNNTFVTGSYHWSAGKVSLEYSDDGSNWVLLDELSNLSDDVTNRFTLTIANSGNHKWYRLNAYPNGSIWPGIGKVVINY